jgi:hypothetical protein
MILRNTSLEKQVTERKERLAELFNARFEFLYARLQSGNCGLLALAISLLSDAKLRSTSLNP